VITRKIRYVVHGNSLVRVCSRSSDAPTPRGRSDLLADFSFSYTNGEEATEDRSCEVVHGEWYFRRQDLI